MAGRSEIAEVGLIQVTHWMVACQSRVSGTGAAPLGSKAMEPETHLPEAGKAYHE